jgi:hypothetical protein
MGRRHAEVIEVRHRDQVPEQFLWRSRLYVVREVLEHWSEAGRWWTSLPAMALAGGDAPAAAIRAQAAPAGPSSLDDGEREFWRVEAGAGRSAALGVYDLCFDWSNGTWQLVEVHD